MSFTQGHALLIGVGTHQDKSISAVPITVTDATAVAAVLRDPAHCGYPAEQVMVLQKDGATKAGILTALDQLADQVKESDTVFLFYCGHGALGTDGNYYLISHDARMQRNRVAAGSGVSEGELLARLKAIRAERMIMVFNACHSGHMSHTLAPEASALQTLNPTEETAAALLGTGKGRIIMVACGEEQYSYIGGGALTIFTQALVDGLCGRGVQNQNGCISAFSLYEQLYAVVNAEVKGKFGGTQAPELTVLKGVGPFPVALYRGASTLGEFAGDQALPQGMAVRVVEETTSAKYFNQRVIQTGGGAAVSGDAQAGRDFVGRDQTVQGDKIEGDKFDGDKVRGNKVGGVSFGNVTGGIHGSVIAGRDAKQTKITSGSAAMPGEAGPTIDKLRQLLAEIQLNLAVVIAQRDTLDAISPDALDTAQGVDKNVNAVTNALQPELAAEQAQSLRQRLDRSAARLNEILDDAKTLAERTGAAANAVQPLIGRLESVVTKLGRATLWVERLQLMG